MRVFNAQEVKKCSGAFSCTFVNNPINWADIAGGAVLGAIRGGSWPGAVAGAGMGYLVQKWDCRW